MSTPENPPRWAPDPLGRHHYRYWDGAAWTDHVSDNGIVGLDPPVAAAPPAASWVEAAMPRRDPTAVLGRRYGAFFIDAAVCTVVFALLFFPFATRRTRAETLRLPGCHLSVNDSSRVECDNRAVFQIGDTVYEANGGAFLGLAVLFTFLYFGVVEGLFGGSFGKHLTRTRVVTEDGRVIGIPRSLARWALFAIDGPLSLFLCGIITSAVSRGHRRLGDMAARTYVVGTADAGRPIELP